MQSLFLVGSYTAKFIEADSIWTLFKGTSKCGVLYEDSLEIRFIDTTVCHHISELTDLRELVQKINTQYRELNNP